MQESIIRFFYEAASPGLDRLVEGITMLGEEMVFIVIIALLYWTISKKQGVILAFSLLFSIVVNSVLKIAVRAPRPFEKLDFIDGKRLETATGYSFPSGHTQGAATFYTTVAALVRKPLVWAAAVLLILLVAVSRVYLGVHWPADVIAGALLGAAIAVWITRTVQHLWEDRKKLRSFLLLLGAIVAVSFVIMTILEITVFRGSWKIDDFYKTAGVFLGGLGGFLLDDRHLGFSASKGSLPKKILRFILGLIVAVALLEGVKLVLPPHYLAHFLRYGLLGLWLTFLFPWIGSKTRLFETEAE